MNCYFFTFDFDINFNKKNCYLILLLMINRIFLLSGHFKPCETRLKTLVFSATRVHINNFIYHIIKSKNLLINIILYLKLSNKIFKKILKIVFISNLK